MWSDVLLLAWSQFGSLAKAVIAGTAGLAFLSMLDKRPWAKSVLAKFKYPEFYYAARFLGVCLVAAAVAGCAPVHAAGIYPTKYDAMIDKAAATYLPGVPPKLLKAQYWVESRLDPTARSPVGAEGIAQFMEGTWSEVSRALGYGLLPRSSAREAIDAGAFYMARLRRNWTAERPWRDRHQLALASYNAGLGHVLAAQRACTRLVPPDFRPWVPALYQDIMLCLPQITGPKHSRETLAYAPLIFRHWVMMEGGA